MSNPIESITIHHIADPEPHKLMLIETGGTHTSIVIDDIYLDPDEVGVKPKSLEDRTPTIDDLMEAQASVFGDKRRYLKDAERAAEGAEELRKFARATIALFVAGSLVSSLNLPEAFGKEVSEETTAMMLIGTNVIGLALYGSKRRLEEESDSCTQSAEREDAVSQAIERGIDEYEAKQPKQLDMFTGVDNLGVSQ